MADYTTTDGARVGILMGSTSDWPTMKKASETLEKFGVHHECNAISAHRNPQRLQEYLADAEKRGVELFICAAGGAAHLAGVVAAHTEKPVLGCPMQAWSLDGLDSLLQQSKCPKECQLRHSLLVEQEPSMQLHLPFKYSRWAILV